MHPTLLHFGRFVLPTFGVLAAVGLMSALSLSLRTAAALGLDPESLWNAGLFTILSAFVLSRLLLIAANLKSFLSFPLLILALPSLTTIGILLTLLATLAYLRLRGLPLLRTLDAWAPCATLVWTFLALGHLAEGSDPGLMTSTRPNFVTSILSPTGLTFLRPVALYVALAAAVITVLLLRFLRRSQPGQTIALALTLSGIAQFLLSFLRQPNMDLDQPFFVLLDPIQWLSLLLVFAAGLILLLAPRKPAPHAL
jgi:phosphatidylglycerol:prolipoprotein diacylglycerol transferase